MSTVLFTFTFSKFDGKTCFLVRHRTNWKASWVWGTKIWYSYIVSPEAQATTPHILNWEDFHCCKRTYCLLGAVSEPFSRSMMKGISAFSRIYFCCEVDVASLRHWWFFAFFWDDTDKIKLWFLCWLSWLVSNFLGYHQVWKENASAKAAFLSKEMYEAICVRSCPPWNAHVICWRTSSFALFLPHDTPVVTLRPYFRQSDSWMAVMTTPQPSCGVIATKSPGDGAREHLEAWQHYYNSRCLKHTEKVSAG